MDSNDRLIFNKGNELAQQNFIPKLDIKSEKIEEILPKNLIRGELRIPDISEVEIVRHYVKLSKSSIYVSCIWI